MSRRPKFIQIAVSSGLLGTGHETPDVLYALDEDGGVWGLVEDGMDENRWYRIPDEREEGKRLRVDSTRARRRRG